VLATCALRHIAEIVPVGALLVMVAFHRPLALFIGDVAKASLLPGKDLET
jgi:hypothetical protein